MVFEKIIEVLTALVVADCPHRGPQHRSGARRSGRQTTRRLKAPSGLSHAEATRPELGTCRAGCARTGRRSGPGTGVAGAGDGERTRAGRSGSRDRDRRGI